jgi:hypothetical protein
MLKINPKIEEALRFPEHGTIIDGVYASQAIDTSAEVIDIRGTDISSLNDDGVLNTEHHNPDKKDSATFSVILGRIIFAKKIFGEEDCESERELDYWRQLQLPFIYGAAELFDAEDHENAKSAAAIIKHYHKRNLPVVIRYSIEGSTLERLGNNLTRTLARRVACTIKPCNRSSYSNLVAEPEVKQVGEDFIEKNEKFISTIEMESKVLIEDPLVVLEDALASIKELNKALTLGGSDVAPSALTQGGALSVEDLGKKRQFFKSQVLAAARDWDGKGSFKEFLKHRLPDADPEFVDRFAQVASHMHLQKDEVKAPDDLSPRYRLRDLNTKPPPGTKQFKGKHVIPGEVELTAGPFQGSKLKLMHLNESHAYVQPLSSGGVKEVTINKLPRSKEGMHFVITQHPHDVDLPNFVHGDKHGNLALTQHHEQKELMHGIDLAKPPEGVPVGSTKLNADPNAAIGWYRNLNGKKVFVKPAYKEPTDDLNPKAIDYMNTADRETVFHNVAKNYFGLGEHVPTTASFKHPDTKHPHSAMELVPDASHFVPKSASHESRDHLVGMGDTGQLDKMAVMDMVMGNGDRNRFNYLTSKHAPHVHLIDNALTFNYKEEGKIPTYLTDYHAAKHNKFDEAFMHPQALQWLIKLDPFALGAELTSQGVHQSIANQAVSRLLSMQSEAIMGKKKTADILFAHGRYAHSPVLREVG